MVCLVVDRPSQLKRRVPRIGPVLRLLSSCSFQLSYTQRFMLEGYQERHLLFAALEFLLSPQVKPMKL